MNISLHEAERLAYDRHRWWFMVHNLGCQRASSSSPSPRRWRRRRRKEDTDTVIYLWDVETSSRRQSQQERRRLRLYEVSVCVVSSFQCRTSTTWCQRWSSWLMPRGSMNWRPTELCRLKTSVRWWKTSAKVVLLTRKSSPWLGKTNTFLTRKHPESAHISARAPSWILSKVIFHAVPLDCQTTAELYDWKIFITAVLTLNFDLDLSKLNREIWHRRKSDLCFSRNHKYNTHNERQTNQPTNKQSRVITITPDGGSNSSWLIL